MVYDQIEFHNVAQLEQRLAGGGHMLLRYPRAVGNQMDTQPVLGERGAYIAQQTSGCEIRFTTPAKTVRVYLTPLDENADIVIMRGDFVHSKRTLPAGVLTMLQLEQPNRVEELPQQVADTCLFHRDVWRICLGRNCIMYHGIDAFGHPVHPPQQGQVPQTKWLAYGSSITQGAGSFCCFDTYVATAARLMGVDAYNLGMGGACWCEKAVADDLASRTDWDFATLELGVNMREFFTPEQFRQRVCYLIDTISAKHPHKPIFLISIFPNSATWKEGDNRMLQQERAFVDILSQIKKPNLHWIDGSACLTHAGMLTCDMIHPSNQGHAAIGRSIAQHIAPVLGLERKIR